MSAFITHTLRFRNGLIERDGELLFRGKGAFPELIREAFRAIGGKDRKFYKMDDLSKLGVLCGGLLVDAAGLTERYRQDRIGVVLSNAASSLESDRQHQGSLDEPEEVPPSPAVFVYTLPNIVIGELCIRHGITGENAFFIFEDFRADALKERVDDLFSNERIDACIAGWCEKDGETYDAFFYSVEREGGPKDPPHEEQEVLSLYRQSMEQ